MKRRAKRRDDLLDVLLELRAAEERGDPMPPVQSEDGAATGWTDDRQARDDPPMESPGFVCRHCNSREYIAVGQSRKGATFYACAGCSGVFMDPAKFGKPAHELVTPGLGHLLVGQSKAGQK
jgi:hypothetical protein